MKPKSKLWIGRVLMGLPVLFLLMDAVMKFVPPPGASEIMAQLGYSMSIMPGLGVTLLLCTILYAVPRTRILGAILLTGYLGGAVATHVRVSNPWPSHILFPVYVGAMLWGGLYLTEPRLQALIPFQNKK
jgi:hypothetical protein